MAKQAAATGQTAPQEKENLQDILLLYDKVGKMLHAVAGTDEKGTPKIEPADDKLSNSFLKVDKGSNIMENFWKNLVSQFKDPTHFNLVSITESEKDDPKIKKALQELAEGKKSKAVKEFLNKYEVRPKQQAVATADNIDWQALEKAGLSREALEKAGMAGVLAKIAAGEQVKVMEAPPQTYRFSEALIDWEAFTKMGVPKEMLIQKGLLDQMLKGYKTNELVPMTLDYGPARIRFEARLSLIPDENGLKMYMNGVKHSPDLDKPFMGHIFSEADKRNLRESGNLGRTVPLNWRDGTSDSLISIDRLTNDIVSIRAENVFIPDTIRDVKLSEQEIADLKEGKAVYLEGMKSNSGREFNAHVQYNADRRGIEYIFESQKLFNAQSIAGVQITDKMREDVNNGKAVLLENMKGRGGELYDRYIKLDGATGNLTYNKYNPDSPEDAREIIIPKELGGVALTAEDRQQMREGKPVYVPDMTTRSGEQRSLWVRSDLKTGELQFAPAPDKFDERAAIKVPQEIMGAKLSATQRAQLQDGKAVQVEGIRAHDGSTIAQWVRMNTASGKPQMFNENPDRTRNPERRNVIQRQADAPAKENKKGRGIQ